MAVKYYDFVIKGNTDLVTVYLNGFFRGKGIKSGYLFTEHHPFQTHLLKELIKYHGEVAHLICLSKLGALVRTAIRQCDNRFEFEIVESKPVKKVTFEFDFKTANRPAAGTIKRLLRRHPAGVKLVAFEPKETFDPGAKGVEVYAPLHDYTYEGKGTIVGDPEGVIKVHKKFSANDFIRCDDIDIHY